MSASVAKSRGLSFVKIFAFLPGVTTDVLLTLCCMKEVCLSAKVSRNVENLLESDKLPQTVHVTISKCQTM